MLVVPLQYYLTQRNPMSPTERSYSVQRLVSSLSVMKDNMLSIKTWQKWYFDCVDYITTTVKNLSSQGSATSSNQAKYTDTDDDEDDEGESPAIEVMKLKDPQGYFAGSPEPRTPRPSNVKYRVGQVIRHKKYGYRGVIIGWDPVAKAPKEWLDRMHPKDKEHWSSISNYSVLVDTRDRTSPQTTYVVEENIEIVSNTKVIHPEIDNYFEHFDGTRYLARPFLKKLYPHDQ
ncbi:uncharacterized protein [Amphiura filiformis]